MNVGRYTTAEGWPGLCWQQEVLTGETVFSKRRAFRWKMAVVLGVGLGGLTFALGEGQAIAVVVGLAMTLVMLAPEAWRALSADFGRDGVTRPLEPSEDEKGALARTRLTPEFAGQLCRAEVSLPDGSSVLRLGIWRRDKVREQLLFEVPLETIDEVQLGTVEEWFGDTGLSALRHQQQVPGQWVIVALTKGYGVLPLARSARSKAEMAGLHQALIAEFLSPRRALLARVEELRGGVANAEPRPRPEAMLLSVQDEVQAIRQSMSAPNSWMDRVGNNRFFAFLLRLVARARDVVVSWVLGLVVLVFVLLWMTGGLKDVSLWRIIGGDYFTDYPVYKKRTDEAAVWERKRAAQTAKFDEEQRKVKMAADKEQALDALAAGFKDEADALTKQGIAWFAVWNLPRRCHVVAEPLAGQVIEFTARYEKLRARWAASSENQELGTRNLEGDSGRLLVSRLRQGDSSGFEHLGWVLEMLGENVGKHRSRSYYPPEAGRVREGLLLYLDAACGRNENFSSKQK